MIPALETHDLTRRFGDTVAVDAINLRVFQAGLSPEDVRTQIALLGDKTLPHLRSLLN